MALREVQRVEPGLAVKPHRALYLEGQFGLRGESGAQPQAADTASASMRMGSAALAE